MIEGLGLLYMYILQILKEQKARAQPSLAIFYESNPERNTNI
jgi:hypothetical protein